MLAPDRTFARRDTALFVLCVALSVGALFAPERWQYAAASSARRTALAPLIALQCRAESSRTSLARFELLTAERDSAAVERMRGQPVVLCVQDSTELDYTAQPGIAGLGPLSYLRQHGLYVHPTLAVTPDGVPLGVLDAWLWTCDRATFGEDKRHWPIEPKESMRWLEGLARCAELAETLPDTRLVYVADRECDIHEFMVRAQREPGIDRLIRATPNRCLAEGDKLWDRLAQAPVLGEVTFTLPARPNRPSRPVALTVRAERVTLPPKGGEPVTVTALRAREESPPVGVEPLDWRLLSNRPADTLTQAAELIQWYGSRWSIEVFFRILKTGCPAGSPPDTPPLLLAMLGWRSTVCLPGARLSDRLDAPGWDSGPGIVGPGMLWIAALQLLFDLGVGPLPEARTLPVPRHLRDGSYKGAKRLGHGEGYVYPHDHPGHFVPQDYLGVEKLYYEPTDQGVEKKIKERLEKWREAMKKMRSQNSS